MFDFATFRAAVEGRDADRWLEFFAEDAEWVRLRASTLYAPRSEPSMQR